MSITKESVSTSTSFSSPYATTKKVDSDIVIDDVVQYADQTSDDPAFAQMGYNEHPAFVPDPESGTMLATYSAGVGKYGVYWKGTEVLVIEYGSSGFTDFQSAVSVDKYTFGSNGDKIAVKFDQYNDLIIVIDMIGA